MLKKLCVTTCMIKNRNWQLTILINQLDQRGSSFWSRSALYQGVSLNIMDQALTSSYQVSRRSVQITIVLFKTPVSTNIGQNYCCAVQPTTLTSSTMSCNVMTMRVFSWSFTFDSSFFLSFTSLYRTNSCLCMIHLFHHPYCLLTLSPVTHTNRHYEQHIHLRSCFW